jgi:hypothetical protein
VHIGRFFKEDEAGNMVLCCKTRYQMMLVFVHTPLEVISDACTECLGAISCDVDVVLLQLLVPPIVMLAGIPGCHPERSEGSLSLGVEMLRCAQHDRVIHQPRHRHLMSFSEFDACSLTLAAVWFKRRILATKKHAHTKPIAVLKNRMQNEAYLHPIQ